MENQLVETPSTTYATDRQSIWDSCFLMRIDYRDACLSDVEEIDKMAAGTAKTNQYVELARQMSIKHASRMSLKNAVINGYGATKARKFGHTDTYVSNTVTIPHYMSIVSFQDGWFTNFPNPTGTSNKGQGYPCLSFTDNEDYRLSKEVEIFKSSPRGSGWTTSQVLADTNGFLKEKSLLYLAQPYASYHVKWNTCYQKRTTILTNLWRVLPTVDDPTKYNIRPYLRQSSCLALDAATNQFYIDTCSKNLASMWFLAENVAGFTATKSGYSKTFKTPTYRVRVSTLKVCPNYNPTAELFYGAQCTTTVGEDQIFNAYASTSDIFIYSCH